MIIRAYKEGDHEACLQIFESNCPPFFDPAEKDLFNNWLNGLDKGYFIRDHISANHFYVLTNGTDIIACGGFYLVKDNGPAKLSWGMVKQSHHKKGWGTKLFQHRLTKLKDQYPGTKLALETSQYSFSFYERMGFKVEKIIPNGLGAGLDRYEMMFY